MFWRKDIFWLAVAIGSGCLAGASLLAFTVAQSIEKYNFDLAEKVGTIAALGEVVFTPITVIVSLILMIAEARR